MRCILKRKLDRPTRKVKRLIVVKHKVHQKKNYAQEKKSSMTFHEFSMNNEFSMTFSTPNKIP